MLKEMMVCSEAEKEEEERGKETHIQSQLMSCGI